MGGLGGGSKISWDGLEYRDIAAFTGPMQKKDVSVGDVGKNCSTHASHGNVGVDIDKTSFPSFTVCMLRFFTRCNIGLAPPVLGSSFSTLFGIIHSLYRQRWKDSFFLGGQSNLYANCRASQVKEELLKYAQEAFGVNRHLLKFKSQGGWQSLTRLV